jgi:hypothetical protein
VVEGSRSFIEERGHILACDYCFGEGPKQQHRKDFMLAFVPEYGSSTIVVFKSRGEEK